MQSGPELCGLVTMGCLQKEAGCYIAMAHLMASRDKTEQTGLDLACSSCLCRGSLV